MSDPSPSVRVQPLPWEWFDFCRKPIPLNGSIPTIDKAGHQCVYRISLDGREVPFKVFRLPANEATRPTLLLLHGMGLSIASFRGLAPYLLQSHDLVLPDYSSLTLRAAAIDPIGMKSFLHSVIRIADVLSLQRFSIAGSSLGGGLALMAALAYPERIDKILLSNPACFPQALPRMYRLARIPLLGEFLMAITPAEKLVGGIEYIGYVDKTRFAPELKYRYLNSLAQLPARLRIMNIMRQLPADHRDSTLAIHTTRLREITQPVFLTWGEQDPLLAQGAGHRLAQSLPNVTFDLHPDLAHMPHEEAPDRIGPRWSKVLTL
jgi:pimeloyl-ACP methyl ester carboxylesterase